MSHALISHAFVLPDENFSEWHSALRPYLDTFDRVVVTRTPGGLDLNAYRNVTAVTAPRTWMHDSPLRHIRRLYPQVVRIDVVHATSPQEMAQVLQSRISANDRFGETVNGGVHLDDRFVFGCPVDYRPLRIIRPFRSRAAGGSSEDYGVDFAAAEGVTVKAVVAGTITEKDQGSLTITTQHGTTTYRLTYFGLRNVSIPLERIVAAGDKLGDAAGDRIRIIVQTAGGSRVYTVPDIIDPMPLLYIDDLRVRPTGSDLRVRTLPDTNGDIITHINPWDQVVPCEAHAQVLSKVGNEGEWLRVRTPEGSSGYAAAWFLEASYYRKIEVNPVGVNLDALHPLGTPDPDQLGNIGWVRMCYNVSNRAGSEDIEAAYERYAPLAEQYARAGYRVCFTTSHQTYGEGKDEFWPWPDMNEEKWSRLIPRFADMMYSIAKQYEGKGLVHCWQIWNEQDALREAVASVPLNAQTYGKMLGQVIPAIRSVDRDVFVITGGHTGGPTNGSRYARGALSVLPAAAVPDGIAFHPYGRGTNPDSPYFVWGHIDEAMEQYSAILPDKPVWITEWGVLNRRDDDPAEIANYAASFIKHLKSKYPEKVACMIWYAWAEGMHNGYGIVDASGKPRPPLTEQFLNV